MGAPLQDMLALPATAAGRPKLLNQPSSAGGDMDTLNPNP